MPGEDQPETGDPKPCAAPTEQAVIDRYLAGASLRKTADQFGMSQYWVWMTLVRAGVPRRPANRPQGSGGRYTHGAHSRDPAVIACYLAGFSLRQTGARFGLTGQGVAVILPAGGAERSLCAGALGDRWQGGAGWSDDDLFATRCWA